MKECENKMSDELEVTNILFKLRKYDSILSFLQSKQIQSYHKYSKSNVVKLETSSDDTDGIHTSDNISSSFEETPQSVEV